MISETAVENRMIQRLATVLGQPDHVEDPKPYFAEIHRMTKHFPTNVMDRAADRLLADAGRKWPTPKSIVDALADAQDAISASNAARGRSSDAPKYPWEIQAEQAQDWADRWMAIHPLADQARREGWARELKDYVKSFARETLRGNRAPPAHTAYQPPADWIAYFRQSSGNGRAANG